MYNQRKWDLSGAAKPAFILVLLGVAAVIAMSSWQTEEVGTPGLKMMNTLQKCHAYCATLKKPRGRRLCYKYCKVTPVRDRHCGLCLADCKDSGAKKRKCKRQCKKLGLCKKKKMVDDFAPSNAGCTRREAEDASKQLFSVFRQMSVEHGSRRNLLLKKAQSLSSQNIVIEDTSDGMWNSRGLYKNEEGLKNYLNDLAHEQGDCALKPGKLIFTAMDDSTSSLSARDDVSCMGGASRQQGAHATVSVALEGDACVVTGVSISHFVAHSDNFGEKFSVMGDVKNLRKLSDACLSELSDKVQGMDVLSLPAKVMHSNVEVHYVGEDGSARVARGAREVAHMWATGSTSLQSLREDFEGGFDSAEMGEDPGKFLLFSNNKHVIEIDGDACAVHRVFLSDGDELHPRVSEALAVVKATPAVNMFEFA